MLLKVDFPTENFTCNSTETLNKRGTSFLKKLYGPTLYLFSAHPYASFSQPFRVQLVPAVIIEYNRGNLWELGRVKLGDLFCCGGL